MSSYFQEIITLLLNPPGNLVYHLVLAFSLAAALSISLSFWQTTDSPEGKRMVVGLGLLLGLRLLLFISAGLSWQGMINGSILLPPLDRFISLIGIILISWMWVFPKPSRLGDVVTLILALVGTTIFAMSLVWWSNQQTLSDFNGSWPDIASVMISLGITTASALLLALRRPAGWGYGLGMMTILLIGDVAYLTYPYPEGDYSGAIRLAQMVAYPILLALPFRFPELLREAKQETAVIPKDIETISTGTQQGNPYQSLFKLIVSTDPANINLAASKMIAQDWLADICLFLSPPGPHGKMEIMAGYDLIREHTMGRSIINSQSIPVIASALRRGRALRLPASSTSPDLAGLGKLLDIKTVGHILAAPVCDPKGDLIAGIVLLTPYSKRSWSVDDQLRLGEFALLLAQVLQQSDHSAKLIRDLNQSQSAWKSAQLEADRARKENEQLLSRLGIESESDGSHRLHAGSLAALIAAHEEAQDTISRLQAELNRLQQGDAQAPKLNEIQVEWAEHDDSLKATDQHAEAELRLALEEIAYLKSLIYEADKKLLLLRNEQAANPFFDRHMKEISALAQELRQPLSSIIGYTDFLLGESIGILGMLQHRFLERIRSSSAGMAELVDHLIQLLGVAETQPAVSVETIPLSRLIDETISKTSHIIQEKKIALRMDFQQNMLELRNNRESLEKLLVALMENASNVSPVEGEITLRVRLKGEEDRKDFVLIQVVHLASAAQFDQLLRFETSAKDSAIEDIHPLSQKQIGLSTLKSLAETLGGRIWVDTDVGPRLTYNLLFPISVAHNSGNNGAGGGV